MDDNLGLDLMVVTAPRADFGPCREDSVQLRNFRFARHRSKKMIFVLRSGDEVCCLIDLPNLYCDVANS